MRKRGNISADRWVKIMCDYSAEGVWMRGGAVALDGFPVSENLKARLRGWQRYYEMNAAPETEVFFDVALFSRVGLDIARAVKAELPDWTVVYFDEALLAAAPESAPKSAYIYEIVLSD
ncbi:hypothetical protein [Salinarimonas rosea]|uniref:hypothetical protein n=1 Tax=Salinarimonas rosea TaxID=552063 RepID=UPI00042768DC|nr:hypothetical protein [Salinarimonas rosea]